MVSMNRGARTSSVEGPPEIGDGVGQGRIGDELGGPHRVDEHLSRNHLAGVVAETQERLHRAGFEVDRDLTLGDPVELRLHRPARETERVAACRDSIFSAAISFDYTGNPHELLIESLLKKPAIFDGS